MYAVEFKTKIRQGMIELPPIHNFTENDTLKVIILKDEPLESNFFDRDLENYKTSEQFKKDKAKLDKILESYHNKRGTFKVIDDNFWKKIENRIKDNCK